MSSAGVSIRQIGRMSKPHLLAAGALLYGLGGAIAVFLGKFSGPGLYLFGQGIVSCIQLMAHFLYAYYHPPRADMREERPEEEQTHPKEPPSTPPFPKELPLYLAAASLLIAGTLVSVGLYQGWIPTVSWILLAAGLLIALTYGAPPLNLCTSGYGELTASLGMAALIPAFAFTLQTNEIHRFVVMSSTPLIAVQYAAMILLQLSTYASDLKYNIQTVTVRLGWATAMRLHDFALVFAILSFMIAYLNGLPRRVALGSVIALPLALAQIWQMERVRRGYPPRFRVVRASAFGLYGLMLYLQISGYLLS
jgi:hypothetical protein